MVFWIYIIPKYKEAKWCCEFFLDKRTHKRSVPDARNKKEAEDYERALRKSIKGGTETAFTDTTNFKDFAGQVYLPYAKNNNVNYKNKVFETNRLIKSSAITASKPSRPN